MAKKFLVNIDLGGNQLLNGTISALTVIKNASSAPTAGGAGSLYYNTSNSTMYFATASGTGSWQPLATGTTAV